MSTGRGGFALLTVLWLILLLSILVATGAAPVALAQRAQTNALHLTRARWSVLACLELTRARFANGRGDDSQGSVELGSTVSCSWESINPDERVNPNLADSAGLVRVLGDSARAAAVLDWIDDDDAPRKAGAEARWYGTRGKPVPRNGPIEDARELRLVRGMDGVTVGEIERVFTARGSGAVSANRAPTWALASVAVLSAEAVTRIVALREQGLRFESAEQLAAAADLELSIPEFAELTRRLSFADTRRILRFRGTVDAGDRVLESVLVVELAELGDELSIVHVEVDQ